MRRKPAKARGIKTGDVVENFSDPQLALIGAVAMAYNEAESWLHQMVGACLRFPGDSWQVVSRINGTEGMVQIVMLAISRMHVPPETSDAFDHALRNEGFTHLKTLRDAVIHARIVDADTAIGRYPRPQGGREDVLLSEVALGCLYLKLSHLGMEMFDLLQVLHCAQRLITGAESDQHKLRLEQSVRDGTDRALSSQRQRLAIPPSPKFPDEPDIFEFPHREGKRLLDPVLQVLRHVAKPRP